MDQTLSAAAQTGDIPTLAELLARDPHLLERVFSLGFCSASPLDIAVLAGQLDFTKEILSRKPEFATVLNKDGYSPIHMASANGHLEIVKVLLMISQLFDYSLCMIKDNTEGRTALHCAVTKGRVYVIPELLCASPDSVLEITYRGETVLHLAVKNNQFEAFKTLMEINIGIEKILNAKDRDGNTVLHLAIFKRHHRIIELLLGRETVGKLEVNTKNAMNLTAMDILDVLLQSSCEWSDIQIGEILRRAGALRTQDIIDHTLQAPAVPHPIPKPVTSQILPTAHVHNSAQPVDHQTGDASAKEPLVARTISFMKQYYNELFREIEESQSETRNSLMVVAVLIATVTYQGALYPPGGVWQDHKHTISPNEIYPTINKKYMTHHAGKAVMAYEPFCYVLFMVLNTVGFVTSLLIISLLTTKFPLKAWLRLAVVSMGTAFGCGFCFIATFNDCAKVFLLFFFCAAIVRWKYWWIEKWAVVKQRRQMSKGLENKDPSFMQRIVRFIAYRSRSVAPSSTVL